MIFVCQSKVLSHLLVEYPGARAEAELSGVNHNALDETHKPLDVDLPPTLPMSFGTENSTVIRAQSGSTAHLPCVVHNIGEGMVCELIFLFFFFYSRNKLKTIPITFFKYVSKLMESNQRYSNSRKFFSNFKWKNHMFNSEKIQSSVKRNRLAWSKQI